MENAITKIRNFLLLPQLWLSVLTVALSVLVWTLLRKFVENLVQRHHSNGKKVNNLPMILSVLKYILFGISGILVLEINGVNVTALVAGIGVAGVVIGFALQDMLKDIIMGTNILMDDFFSVGDIVSFESVKLGEVLGFNMKTTRILDLHTGDVLTVSNRSITEIIRVSDWQVIGIPAPYTETAERMRSVCGTICEEVETLEAVKSCTFLGTGAFADSYIEYSLRVSSAPQTKPAVRRAVLGVVQDVFAREGIEIPYPQLDVHLDR